VIFGASRNGGGLHVESVSLPNARKRTQGSHLDAGSIPARSTKQVAAQVLFSTWVRQKKWVTCSVGLLWFRQMGRRCETACRIACRRYRKANQ